MDSKQHLLSLILTLTLTLSFGTGVTGKDCDFVNCTCRGAIIDCKHRGLTALPTFKNGSFPQLFLDVSDNNISSIHGGELPAGIHAFFCKHNPISKLTHSAFQASAATLYNVVIQNSPMSHIPNLGYLNNLTDMYLDHNQITDISFVSLLHALERIVVGNNNISDIDTITLPTSLHWLDLTFNKIENISSLSFAHKTSSLTVLLLRGNPLKHISRTAFDQAPHLADLNLQSTSLTRLPLALLTLTDLTWLDLRYITGLVCTCEEAGLSPWRRNMTSLRIAGDCDGASVDYFLEKLAPNCPPNAAFNI